jgi:alcohol dehydrogenase (cytochrome c)
MGALKFGGARAALVCALLASTSMALAADVTFERLRRPEPQNWLMNHGDFSAHRYSSLDQINKANVKNLKLKFSVAIGGKGGNENLLATPLVDDGFMYMSDAWGVVYKIDVRSGTRGNTVWKMDPGQEKMDRNRGVALWRNLVISVTSHDVRVVATDKETGKIVWDKNLRDQPDMTLNAAPLALEDSILVGASGGDQVSPVHAQRHDGFRRGRLAYPHRYQGQRRGAQASHPCRA